MSDVVRLGDTIGGRYVVERKLGEGGMGIVFVARQEDLARRVAIKFLLSESANNAAALARFEREARAAAKLQSDHVAKVLDIGKLPGGSPYFVMELLDGEDMAQALERRGPFRCAKQSIVSCKYVKCFRRRTLPG